MQCEVAVQCEEVAVQCEVDGSCFDVNSLLTLPVKVLTFRSFLGKEGFVSIRK